RAAEREPQEEEQPEARQREGHHDEDPPEAEAARLHQGWDPAPACDGQIGRCRRLTRVPSAGLTLAIAFSCRTEEQDRTSRPRRTAPIASWVENTALASWLAQASQNR